MKTAAVLRRVCVICLCIAVLLSVIYTGYAAENTDNSFVIWYCNGNVAKEPQQGIISADVGIRNDSEESVCVEIFLAVYDMQDCLNYLVRQERTLAVGETCVAATQAVKVNENQKAALYVWQDMMPLGEHGEVRLVSPEEDKVMTAYRGIDREFLGVFDWLTKIYDPESGGFYTTVSGAVYKGYVPSLESTAFVCQMLTKGESGAIEEIPPEMKQKLINFFQSRQNTDGFFYDTGFGDGDYTDRDKIRLYGQCVDALKVLGVKPKYTPQYVSQYAIGYSAVQYSQDNGNLPEYCRSTERFAEYIRSLNWDNNSWEAGDLAYEAMSYALLLDDSDDYKAVLLEFLKDRQDFVSGYWGKSGDYSFNACSGAFKVSMIYNRFSMCPNNPEKILESVAKTLDGNDFPTAACYVRNPISIIQLVSRYEPELVKSIYRNKEERLIEQYKRYIHQFFQSDGGASSDAYMAKTKFGGIPSGLGLCEGDSDGTRQMWIARKDLYHIFGREPDSYLYKPMYAEFWNGLLNKPPVVKRQNGSEPSYENDFQKTQSTDELYLNNWSANGFGAAIAEENGNRFLKLTDTSLSFAERMGLNLIAQSTSGQISCKIRFDRTDAYSKLQSDLSYTYLALSGDSSSLIELHATDTGGNTIALNTVYDTSGGNKYQKLTDIPIGVWNDLSVSYKKTDGKWSITYCVNDVEYTSAENVYTGRSINFVNRMELITSARRTSVICIDDIRIIK